MKTKLVLFAGVLAFGASLQASTSYSFYVNNATGTTNSQNEPMSGLNTANIATVDGNDYLSPYEGTLSTTTNGVTTTSQITLFCDDFNDTITVGQVVSANISSVDNAGTANNSLVNDTSGTNGLGGTRYGSANPNSSYPSGTTLYEEMAWLNTQLISGGLTAANDEAVEEAIWTMTADSANQSKVPTTATGSQTVSQWINDAEYEVTNGATGTLTSGTYLTPNYNDWVIITDVNAAGCDVGGDTGETGGVACSGTGAQEFLAYVNSPTTTKSNTTPEPASFVLIGSGLLMGAIFGRRRRAANKK